MADTVFRGEHWELSYGKETVYGSDPGTANLTVALGIFERGQLADPEIEFTPFYGAGGEQNRRYFRAYHGKWTLEANVSDIQVLSGKNLVLPLGTVVTTGPVGSVYTHTISESTLLQSLTLHASFWRVGDTTVPTLMRRYLGGKVSRATFSAEEEQRVQISYDSLLFHDISHNIAAETLKYSAGVARPTVTYPTTDPYFFSGGTVSIAGTTFARVRSFRLDINNNCEAKYYIAGHDPCIPIPYTVLEGRREYNLTVVVDPEDTFLYTEVIRRGRTAGSPIGIQVILHLARCENAVNDYIELSLPSGTPAFPSNQGCFIKRGRLDIDSGSPAVQQELEILARSVTCVCKDADAWAEF